jgi:hypothetical protein
MLRDDDAIPEGYEVVFTAFITLRNGRRLYASTYGLRAFRLLVRKKAEMHAAAVALHFMYYNFAKIHQTLRVTPAMEAGVSDHAWEISEIVDLLDSAGA